MQTQSCEGGAHSGSKAISVRGDLSPLAPACNAVSNSARINEGGIDLKYTSYSILRSSGSTAAPWLRYKAQSGPTKEGQAPFVWSASPFANLSHLGMPDAWQFGWVDYDTQWS